MLRLRIQNITVEFDHHGGRHFKRTGLSNWLGNPVLVYLPPYRFTFDLEGRIQQIDGFPSPHSWDWIQRTMANDWIYYDRVWVLGNLPQPADIIGDSAWAINGRTDLPILQGHHGLQRDYVKTALNAFDSLIARLKELAARKPIVLDESGHAACESDTNRLGKFLNKAADRQQLQCVADRLHEISGTMMVLPPDTLEVDYRVLLVKLMDGCPNSCDFCTVRGDLSFALRTQNDIDRQIDAVAEIYGDDLGNYNAVVFGECDALLSPWIEYAANRAFDVFHCGSSYHAGSMLFLFATNQTLLQQTDRTFDMLDALSFEQVRINVGWEAASDAALARLGKRQTAAEVLAGMEKAGTINRKYDKVRISGNFITADGFECDSIANAICTTQFRGRLYLSPLQGKCSAEKALNDLRTLRQTHPGARVRLYTMQRM